MPFPTSSTRATTSAILGLAALLALSNPTRLSAQDSPGQANPLGALVGAVAGGALGFIGGAYIGARGDCYEICGGIVVGALAGQTLGVPLGAHVGNGGRGNLTATLGASLLSVGVGIAGTHATSSENFFLASMVGQVAAVTVAEIKTSPNLSVSAGPRLVGEEVGVGLTIRW